MNSVTMARPSAKQAEKIAYENNKLHKRLCRLVGQAIGDFNMIEAVTRSWCACRAVKTATRCWISC